YLTQDIASTSALSASSFACMRVPRRAVAAMRLELVPSDHAIACPMHMVPRGPESLSASPLDPPMLTAPRATPGGVRIPTVRTRRAECAAPAFAASPPGCASHGE